MEIYDKQDKGYIEVWLSKEEQKQCDRPTLTKHLFNNVKVKKCKVVFFLSGDKDLFDCTESLLLKNLGFI